MIQVPGTPAGSHLHLVNPVRLGPGRRGVKIAIYQQVLARCLSAHTQRHAEQCCRDLSTHDENQSYFEESVIRWSKHTNFELDTHVPMIIADPHHPKGVRVNALTEFVDIYPTLAELCGLPVAEDLEGTSMIPLMTDPKTPWKKAAFRRTLVRVTSWDIP